MDLGSIENLTSALTCHTSGWVRRVEILLLIEKLAPRVAHQGRKNRDLGFIEKLTPLPSSHT